MRYRVPNALPGRGSVNVEIFGMAGVPEGAAPGITVPIGTELTLVPPCFKLLLHASFCPTALWFGGIYGSSPL